MDGCQDCGQLTKEAVCTNVNGLSKLQINLTSAVPDIMVLRRSMLVNALGPTTLLPEGKRPFAL